MDSPRPMFSVHDVFTASKHGDMAKLRKYVEKEGRSLSDHHTAIHAAVENNHVEVVRYLIEHGADVNATNKDGRTPLHCAIIKEESELPVVDVSDTIKILDYLLEHDADVNATDKDGMTPLHLSILHFFVLKEKPENLLKLPAVDVSDTIKLLDYLLAHGANVNATNKDGMTALHFLILNEKPQLQAVDMSDTIKLLDYLLEHEADVNATDKDGMTALHLVILHFFVLKEESELRAVDVSDTIKLLDYLLEHKMDVNATNKDGWTPLHFVILNEKPHLWAVDVFDTIKLLDYLLEHGADVNATDKDGMTALHLVILHFFVLKEESELRAVDVSDTIKLLDYLLAHEADVNATNKDGRTALHFVIQNEKPHLRAVDVSDAIKLLDYLLEHEADVNATDKDGMTTLHLVILHFFVLKEESEFRAVDVSDTIKLLDYLLEHEADVNATNKDGRTALHFVLLHEKPQLRAVDVSDTIKLLDYLLEHEVDVNATDKYGMTALHLLILHFVVLKEETEAVVVSDTIKLLDYLLEHGADVNAVDGDGRTILHLVVILGEYMKLPYYLVEHRADVNAVDDLGITALHLAVLGGHIDLASYLVENGTNVNAAIINTVRQTVMDKKHRNKCYEIYDIAKRLMESVDRDLLDKSGFTALHIVSVQKDNYNILLVDLLFQNGVSLEITTPDGYTAVHTAVKMGNTRFLSHIIMKYNAKVNLPDNIGRTPLHWAAYMGSTDIIRLLLFGEAYQGTQDDQGCTALHLAAREGHLEACTVLTRASTKKELLMRDKNGFTPFELATNRGHQIVATVLDHEETRTANCESSSGNKDDDDDGNKEEEEEEEDGFKLFSVSDIKRATNKFNKSAKIGQGGYGTVYKGFLDNKEVAIKILDDKSTQGKTEFLQEMVILGQMRHPNLVNLIGACFKLSCLVYEYLPNGSLEDCIKKSPRLLTWQIRTRILYEICLALIFLHSNKPPLVHGDLKPHNVLLDVNFKSKIADFGFCRFLSDGTSSLAYHYTKPKGTFGYIDPIFQETGELTPDCDVYSFGVTILRVLTGNKPIGIYSKVRAAFKGKSITTMVDPSAGDWPSYVAELLAYFGLRCYQRKGKSSKLMQEISNDLKNILTEHGIEVII